VAEHTLDGSLHVVQQVGSQVGVVHTVDEVGDHGNHQQGVGLQQDSNEN